MAKRIHEHSPGTGGLVFTVLCTLTAVASWQFVLRPEYEAIRAIRDGLRRVVDEQSQARQAAAALPALQHEVESLERSLRQTESVVAGERDSPELLQRLHELASESLLDITSFKPKQIATNAQYNAWATELGVAGTYHDLGRFLGRIATLSGLIAVSELTIQGKTNQQGHGSITATALLTAYTFGRDPAETAESEPRVSVWLASRVEAGESAYDDRGTRDPFASLVLPKASANRSDLTRRPSELAMVAIADVAVRGIAAHGPTRLAILEVPGNESFVTRVGDRLLDGSVTSIDSVGVVFAGNTGHGAPSTIRKLLERWKGEDQ